MSKSRGNVVSPRDRRALRRRHGPLLHPLHRPARPGRRLVRRGRRGRAPLPRPAVAPERRAWPSRRPDDPIPDAAVDGDDLELLRKAHWAIEKVTDDLAGRFAFNTAIAAVMELINEVSRLRERGRAPGALRFALATAASLLFPFAPHVSRRRLRAADRRARVGAAVADGRPGAARARHLRARLPGQRQGPRPRAGAVGRGPRRARGAVRSPRRTCARTSTAARSSR